MEYTVYVSFRCPVELERQVRIEAAKKDQNRTEFIIAALRKVLGQLDATESTQDQDKPN